MKYGQANLICKLLLFLVYPHTSQMRASKNRCVQYFDGVTTFEEITYRTGLQRKELEKILQLYNGDVRYIMLLIRVSMLNFCL